MTGAKVKKLYKLLAKRLRTKRFPVFLIASIVFSCSIISLGMGSFLFAKERNIGSVLGVNIKNVEKRTILISPVVEITLAPTNTPVPTPTPTDTPTPTPVRKKTVTTPIPTKSEIPQGSNSSQYTAQKINDVTWKVSNISNDDHMASPQELLNALNSYRGSHGVGNLAFDQKLGEYAQGRADLFSKNGSLDSHAGFQNYMNNGGFDLSGFNSLGENSAYLAGPMNADRIIRNIFGADGSHDGNQLDPSWTHVGIGVSGRAVNINFGKNKK